MFVKIPTAGRALAHISKKGLRLREAFTHYDCYAVIAAARWSRFILAMVLTEIPLGQAASHS